MSTNFVDSYRTPKRSFPWKKVLIAFFIFLALIGLYVAYSVFATADNLMRRESGERNPFATNMMPTHDELNFYSLDEATQLNGWFFRGNKYPALGNILIVHNNGDSKAQFGLKTGDLYRNLQEEGYNVFAFDLQHSGNSGGELSGFGYFEYEDVIAAMQTIKKLTGSTDFVLFGIGTGCNASLFAYDQLPSKDTPREKLTEQQKKINVSREDIKAFIFDTPVAKASDYIKAEIPQDNFYQKYVLRKLVPQAVKMSSGSSETDNLLPFYSSITIPMLLMANSDDQFLEQDDITAVFNERIRLLPSQTATKVFQQTGHLNAYRHQAEEYIDQLNAFLDRWLGETEQ